MDIIKTYNPANKLSDEEQAAMVNLTDAEIAELAKAYPNQPTGNAYLEYWMKNEKDTEQRYPLGTWANLNSLRKLGKSDILPYRFRRSSAPKKAYPVPFTTATRTVDLSKEEASKAEGLKQEPVQEPANNEPAKTEGTNEPGNVNAPVVSSPELIAAEKELQQAIDDKAHPNTIRAKQKKVDELKAEPAKEPAQAPSTATAIAPGQAQSINLNAL